MSCADRKHRVPTRKPTLEIMGKIAITMLCFAAPILDPTRWSPNKRFHEPKVNKTVTMGMRSRSLYISQPSSEKKRKTKVKRKVNFDGSFFIVFLELNDVINI